VSKISAWKELFLKHGPLFTSVASVAIAVMAFFLTIYNARLDRQYKELGIRPSVHLHVETSDFHVGFLNTGLGPAEIISVATKFQPDKCLIFFQRQKLPTDDVATFTENTFEVMRPINAYFADPLAQLLQPDSIWDPPRTPKLYARTLTPGEVVPPGQEVTIFEVQKETMEIMQKKLQTLSSADYNALMHRFIARAQAIPYYVHFCSLTGEYCVNQVQENCGN
jgi:hypothetical protein